MSAATAEPSFRVTRWPSERPLRVLIAIVAIAIWILLSFSVIGIIYVALIGFFLLIAQIAFVAHLRGSAVRLGPEQMPELHERVTRLSQRIGLARVPDAYVMQAGGTLNAFATKFFRTNFIVLFSELLDACGENDAARDFIVAHELGHLHAGHLRWRWLLLPGIAFPFLGTAYSRACEYTCDRYGQAANANDERALDGLCILAAGGREGPRVNRRALVAQRQDLDRVLMKIGQWLSTHPPIALRLLALAPNLGESIRLGSRATIGALLTVMAVVVLPMLIGGVAIERWWPQFQAAMQQQAQQQNAAGTIDPQQIEVEAGILALARAAQVARDDRQALPPNLEVLYAEWASRHPGESPPLDPFTGARYGYRVEGVNFVIWTSGPDPNDQSDDIYFSSVEHTIPPEIQ